MDATINVDSFDFNRLPQHGLFGILGKRGTGKTQIARYILQQLSSARTGMFAVIAGSKMVESSWRTVVHPLYIISGLSDGAGYLGRIINQQNRNLCKYEARGEEIPASLGITIVLDDCASINSIMRSKELAYLAANGRHCHVTILILTQYYNQIITSVRCNIDIMFVLATANAKIISKLREEFASSTSMRLFKCIVSAVTDNFGCLVIDNRINAKTHENLKSMRIPYPFEEQRLGSQSMWHFAEAHYLNINDRTLQQKLARQDQLLSESGETGDDDNDTLSHSDIVHLQKFRTTFSDKVGQVTIKTMPSKRKID